MIVAKHLEMHIYSSLAAKVDSLRKQVWPLTRRPLNMRFTCHVVPMAQSRSLAVYRSHSKQIP